MPWFFKTSLFAILAVFILTACGSGGSSSDSDDNDEGDEAVVSAIAGDGTAGYLDATGLAARFDEPLGVTTDGVNLYVAEGNNRRIRQIEIATGVVTTFAGNGSSNDFVDDRGVAAELPGPGGITGAEITGIGSVLFFTDTSPSAGSLTRSAVIAFGDVGTIAGDPVNRGLVDGAGAAAQFNNPEGITWDGTHLYVADTRNHSIQQIDSTSVVATFAGNDTAGFVDAIGGAARFDTPFGITNDGTNLYVADTENHSIRQIAIASGVVTTLAGNGTAGFRDGAGASARFDTPIGITTDGVNLYVSDSANHRLRQIAIATGSVTTLAGDGTAGYQNGNGTATKFNFPWGITVFGKTLYVNDKEGHRVRRVQLP